MLLTHIWTPCLPQPSGIMSPPKQKMDPAAKLAKYRNTDKEAGGENGAGPSPHADPAAEDTARVLEAMDCKSTLTSKIEEVKVDVSLIRQDLQKLRDRVTEAEACISRVEDKVLPLQVHTERLQHQLNMVLAKQDDMESSEEVQLAFYRPA